MNIIGHDRQRAFLRKIVSEGLPHHAFLISGPEGIGKTSVALEFAALLLGMSEGDPSGKQDFHLIRPEISKEGKKTRIQVADVREAGTFLSRFPAESTRRVLMIDDADTMNESAQNAILKQLEEPNGSSVLILVTSRPGALRETIRSRAFRVPLSLISEPVIRSGAEATFGKEALAGVEPFFFALGRPGIVFGALSDPTRFAVRRELLRSLFKLSSLSMTERFALSERLSGSVPEAIRLLEWWVSGLRFMRRDEQDAKRLSSSFRFLEEVEEAARTLRETNANARLVLDRLFLVALP